MQFTFALIIFPALAVADFNLWSMSCTTAGLQPFENYGISTDSQGACGGCGADMNFGGGNPCNGDCGADPLRFESNGDNLDIIVANTGINVGSCHTTPASPTTCDGTGWVCSVAHSYRCVTAYCN